MKTPPPVRITINERRAYFESRYGQLHVRTAFPSTGGFDERTPLLCLHEEARSSTTFQRFATAMATDRSVYAPDLPGHGLSDGPGTSAGLDAVVQVVADLLDTLRLRSVDVVGYGLGAALATELAVSRPGGVRRLALFAVPTGTEGRPRHVPPVEDGAHLLSIWREERMRRGSGESLDVFAAGFAESLALGERVDGAGAALQSWNAAERLSHVQQPILLCTPRSARSDLSVSRRVSVLDGATFDADLFVRQTTDVAVGVATFLDRD